MDRDSRKTFVAIANDSFCPGHRGTYSDRLRYPPNMDDTKKSSDSTLPHKSNCPYRYSIDDYGRRVETKKHLKSMETGVHRNGMTTEYDTNLNDGACHGGPHI